MVKRVVVIQFSAGVTQQQLNEYNAKRTKYLNETHHACL